MSVAYQPNNTTVLPQQTNTQWDPSVNGIVWLPLWLGWLQTHNLFCRPWYVADTVSSWYNTTPVPLQSATGLPPYPLLPAATCSNQIHLKHQLLSSAVSTYRYFMWKDVLWFITKKRAVTDSSALFSHCCLWKWGECQHLVVQHNSTSLSSEGVWPRTAQEVNGYSKHPRLLVIPLSQSVIHLFERIWGAIACPVIEFRV